MTKWKCPKCGNSIEEKDGNYYGNLVKKVDKNGATCVCKTQMVKI